MFIKVLLFSIVFVGMAFGQRSNPQRKYNDLYQIIKEDNDVKVKNYAMSHPQHAYVWQILSPKRFPDCNGEFSSGTIYGLYKNLGGEKYGAQILNKETYEDDGYIETQVLVVTFLKKNIGEHRPDKHYRAHVYRYYINTEEWWYMGVGMYVKTWEVKVKQEFAGWKGEVWETRGVCPKEGKGEVSADLWRKTKKFFGF